MRVLIVDDSATMRKIITRCLRQAGYKATELYEAGDGLEALEVLDKNDVDVIFSDVNMPNMNGIEFLDALKERGTLDSIPVVMITTESTPESVRLFVEHGASGCVPKPCTADQLEDVVSAVLD
ncbi:MAG: response regulator [Myxococcota bacterium]